MDQTLWITLTTELFENLCVKICNIWYSVSTDWYVHLISRFRNVYFNPKRLNQMHDRIMKHYWQKNDSYVTFEGNYWVLNVTTLLHPRTNIGRSRVENWLLHTHVQIIRKLMNFRISLLSIKLLKKSIKNGIHEIFNIRARIMWARNNHCAHQIYFMCNHFLYWLYWN